MLLDSLSPDASEFAARTGWELKPEGACKGEVCVPLPDGVIAGDRVNVALVADRLGMPLIADDDEDGPWALGAESGVTGRALTTAVAPELTLPDLRTGEMFSLSSLRGQKVLLLAWASW